jgi:hypothetical protein
MVGVPNMATIHRSSVTIHFFPREVPLVVEQPFLSD